jgi:hypothetical protein
VGEGVLGVIILRCDPANDLEDPDAVIGQEVGAGGTRLYSHRSS